MATKRCTISQTRSVGESWSSSGCIAELNVKVVAVAASDGLKRLGLAQPRIAHHHTEFPQTSSAAAT